MKNIFKKAVCIAIAMLVVVSGIISSAATTKSDIVACAEQCVPSQYSGLYISTFKAALSRIKVSSEQADKVIAIMKGVKAQINQDKGHTLHLYTKAEREIVMNGFAKCCDILGLTYTVTVKSDNVAVHKMDEIIKVYAPGDIFIVSGDGDIGLTGPDGKPTTTTITDKDGNHLVAIYDGDIVKKTDYDSDRTTQTVLFVIAVAALVLAIAAYIISKKFVVKEK